MRATIALSLLLLALTTNQACGASAPTQEVLQTAVVTALDTLVAEFVGRSDRPMRPRMRSAYEPTWRPTPRSRRWCADAGRPTRFKPSSPSPTDAVRDGSAKLGHPVQNVTREHGLTPLPR